ncbi:type III polyketide synthase [Roseomonas marmotae]|uniref:Type III polyketide synthase n=1 Tax=Roseomonas marmotae TaxID=2768161 RepID=A0ABS3K783_9PROT|nr:type III polyketide synthase [Roseomonas marmotae]MBO1073316.1 type III polyketide synthase [Roseomonas marmotae]QTI79067.1 type III polyketide synthase [Roseomonas marmotae]
MPATAYINRIATAVPPHDVHDGFIAQAGRLLREPRRLALFHRMAERSHIAHRWSFLACNAGDGPAIDTEGFYRLGQFPSTAARMQRFEREAAPLAIRAVEALELGDTAAGLTHLITISCTGFAAPGVDFALIRHFGLDPGIERSMVGFMGCHAAINGLKLARHIVRSEPGARVLLVSLELCTLHLQESDDLEQVLSFLIFADGCAAALVTAEPEGIGIESFQALLVPETEPHISWRIGDQGFDMVLSGRVPAGVAQGLRTGTAAVLRGAAQEEIGLWAIHPGGRSVLDAVENALELPPEALRESRAVLRDYGNMSSATVLFVLREMLRNSSPGQRGCAMAFGPGMVAETMLFHRAGAA